MCTKEQSSKWGERNCPQKKERKKEKIREVAQ